MPDIVTALLFEGFHDQIDLHCAVFMGVFLDKVLIYYFME
jgi:hypothetical protein